MLLLGSGVDKLLHQNQRAHALIVLASGIRILFLSILVGTTAALIFEDRKPMDANNINKSTLNKILSEGVAVNAGTKMHDWLLNQVETHNLDQASHSGIVATERKGALSEALDSRLANHILSDVSVLTQVLQNVNEPATIGSPSRCQTKPLKPSFSELISIQKQNNPSTLPYQD